MFLKDLPKFMIICSPVSLEFHVKVLKKEHKFFYENRTLY